MVVMAVVVVGGSAQSNHCNSIVILAVLLVDVPTSSRLYC